MKKMQQLVWLLMRQLVKKVAASLRTPPPRKGSHNMSGGHYQPAAYLHFKGPLTLGACCEDTL